MRRSGLVAMVFGGARSAGQGRPGGAWAFTMPIVTGRRIRLLYAAVVLLTCAVMAGTIWFMAAKQNADALQSEIKRADGVKAFLLHQMDRTGTANAFWDDAYINAVLALDVEWLDNTLGPATYGAVLYQDIFIVDEGGRPLYASVMGKRVDDPSSTQLPRNIDRLLHVAKQNVEVGVSAFARNGTGLCVVSVDRIRPVQSSVARRVPHRYLVLVQHLSPNVLTDAARISGFEGLTLRTGMIATPAQVPIHDAGRSIVGSLSWRSEMPGYGSALDVLPAAVALLAFAAYVGWLLSCAARRWTDDLVESRAEATHLASHDVATGLPNRRAFTDLVDGHLATGDPFALLYLDLDGFKNVNDAFGHEAGDTLLSEVTSRLGRLVEGSGRLARIGGDEFAVVVAGPRSHQAAPQLADRLTAAFADPYSVGGADVVVGASIGVTFSKPGMARDEAVRQADVAMYTAKGEGKRCWRLYDPAMDDDRMARRVLERELRDAIRSGELSVALQPIVDATSRERVAVEALARWHSPTLGTVSPERFIPVAEDSGCIGDLAHSVLRQACIAVRDHDVDLAVNLSPAQLWDAGLVPDIVRILDETGFPPTRLEFEITENYLVARPEIAAEVLDRLRRLGIRIALDDFGMGFASLGYLRRFTLDRIKLDRSLTAHIAESPKDAAIVAAVVDLARALALPVTAEGVETGAQASMLRFMGCTRLQGWHFGRPVPAGSLEPSARDRAEADAERPAAAAGAPAVEIAGRGVCTSEAVH